MYFQLVQGLDLCVRCMVGADKWDAVRINKKHLYEPSVLSVNVMKWLMRLYL